MKKGYSPFKMWGSWTLFTLLLIIGIIGLYLTLTFGCTEMCGLTLFISTIPTSILFSYMGYGFSIREGVLIPILLILSNAVVGFLVGWGVHSLVRWFKNAF